MKDANTSGGVPECFSDVRRKSILRNRSALGTLIRSAVFCARQAIGLRGHREHQCKSDNKSTPSVVSYFDSESQSDSDDESDSESTTDKTACKSSRADSRSAAPQPDHVNSGNFKELVGLLKMESEQIKETLDKLP